MAIRLFLKVTDIKGESTDDKHKDEIDVESFSWGLTQAAASGGGGFAGASHPAFADFSFTAGQSIASPLLFLSCAQGKHLKEAILTVRRTGKTALDFYKITFTDVLLRSFQESGADGAAHVGETVSFEFHKISVEYQRQNAKGGLEPPVTASWDVVANKKF